MMAQEIIAAVRRNLETLRPLEQWAAEAEQERARLQCENEELQAELLARTRERDELAREREERARELDVRIRELHTTARGLAGAQRRLDDLSRAQAESLLKHALFGTRDFEAFTLKRVLSMGCNGVVMLCAVRLPAWAVLHAADSGDGSTLGRALPVAVGRGEEVEMEVAVKVLVGVDNPRHTAVRHKFLFEYYTLCDVPPMRGIMPLYAYFTKCLPDAMYAALPEGFRLMLGRRADPVLALVMPFHPRTLAEAAPEASPEQLRRWVLDVAGAVAHLWQHRWVHLDLKLDNVVVSSDDHAVLADFGTAKRVGADGKLRVSVGMGLEGNQAHRAPELLQHWQEQSHAFRHDPTHVVELDGGRQEVWALGVLLHEMVAGEHPCGESYPFGGRDSVAAVDTAALRARGLNEQAVATLQRMVSHEADRRPENPVAVHEELVTSLTRAGELSASGVTGALAEEALRGVAPSARELEAELLAERRQRLEEQARVQQLEQQLAAQARDTARLRTELDRRLLEEGAEGVRARASVTTRAPLPLPVRALRPAAKRRTAAAAGVAELPAAPDETKALRKVVDAWDGARWRGNRRATAQLQAWCDEAQGAARHAARLCVAELHRLGYGGVPKDPALAIALASGSVEWCRAAAHRGDSFAQFLLGVCAIRGDVIPQDRAMTRRMFQLSAEQGYVDAQFWLGESYLYGFGRAVDKAQAVRWLRRANDQDHPAALRLLCEAAEQSP